MQIYGAPFILLYAKLNEINRKTARIHVLHLSNIMFYFLFGHLEPNSYDLCMQTK